jgi:hypothetical protein
LELELELERARKHAEAQGESVVSIRQRRRVVHPVERRYVDECLPREV